MKRLFILAMILAAGAGSVDRFPSIKTFEVTNIYSTGENPTVGWRYYGANMDVVLNGAEYTTYGVGGNYFDRLKQAASDSGWHVETYRYTNIHNIIVCGDTLGSSGDCQYNSEWVALMSACDAANGGNQSYRDSLFITIGDSALSQALNANSASCPAPGGTRIADGAVADLRKQRFSVREWLNTTGDAFYPSGRTWIMNYWYSKIISIRAASLVDWNDNHICGDSAVDGNYHDNAYPREGFNMNTYIHLNGSWGGATGGSGYSTNPEHVDWDQLASPYSTVGKNTGAAKYCTFVTAVSESLLFHGYRTVMNYAAPYPVDWLDNMCLQGGNPTNNGDSVVADAFFEESMDNFIYGPWSDVGRLLRYVDTCRNHPTMRKFWELRWGGSGTTDTGPAWYLHAGYTAFLVIQDTASYFATGCASNVSSATVDGEVKMWSNWDIMNFDLGYPVKATLDTIRTGASHNGGSVHLLKREYTEGWALFLPKETATGLGSDTSDYYTYNLGEPVKVLGENHPGHAWDSTYKADGNVNIKYGHGTIVTKIRGESGPTILYINPSNGYEGYLDSTYTVTAQISDDYGLDSCYNYLRHPMFDSLLINKEVYGVDITEATPSVDITWPFIGTSHIVYVVWDDSGHVARDSSTILITQPVVSQDTLVTQIKGVTIQNQGIEP